MFFFFLMIFFSERFDFETISDEMVSKLKFQEVELEENPEEFISSIIGSTSPTTAKKKKIPHNKTYFEKEQLKDMNGKLLPFFGLVEDTVNKTTFRQQQFFLPKRNQNLTREVHQIIAFFRHGSSKRLDLLARRFLWANQYERAASKSEIIWTDQLVQIPFLKVGAAVSVSFSTAMNNSDYFCCSKWNAEERKAVPVSPEDLNQQFDPALLEEISKFSPLLLFSHFFKANKQKDSLFAVVSAKSSRKSPSEPKASEPKASEPKTSTNSTKKREREAKEKGDKEKKGKRRERTAKGKQKKTKNRIKEIEISESDENEAPPPKSKRKIQAIELLSSLDSSDGNGRRFLLKDTELS